VVLPKKNWLSSSFLVGLFFVGIKQTTAGRERPAES